MEFDFKSENGATVPSLSGRLDSAEFFSGGSRLALMRNQKYVGSAVLPEFPPKQRVRVVSGLSGFSTIFTLRGGRNGARAALK